MLGLIRADGSVWVDVLPATLLSALGFGLTLTPLTITATSGVAPGDAGLASGLFNSAQEVGAATRCGDAGHGAAAASPGPPSPTAVGAH